MTFTAQQRDAIALTHHYEAQQDIAHAVESASFAHALLDEICAQIISGVRESEVKAFAQACFAQHGVERIWHQPYIRFGSHTLLTYRDKTAEDFRLGESDIAFVDIGVVKNGIEGDAGKTIVMGNNTEYHRLKDASEAIFHEAIPFGRKIIPAALRCITTFTAWRTRWMCCSTSSQRAI